jgi:hypothetical protein
MTWNNFPGGNRYRLEIDFYLTFLPSFQNALTSVRQPNLPGTGTHTSMVSGPPGTIYRVEIRLVDTVTGKTVATDTPLTGQLP